MHKIKTLTLQTVSILLIGLACLQPANAGMVGTPALIAAQQQLGDTQAQRLSITQQLVELGVDQTAAQARVAALSDVQINELNSRLAEQPAGADVGGILLTVFIVFVITDVIGATDIFPFIKPVR